MAILYFLVSLFGATMLLLFAVRMVQTGIERAYGASFKRVVTDNTNPLRAALTGTVMAIVLQSSAAVALLTAGFAGAGLMQFPMGLSVILGADLGSAIVVQILSLRLDWLVPLLIAVGGWTFLHAEKRKLKQAGRIIMGIALILIALRFLRETVEPIRDSAFLPALVVYLENDAITAFLAGSVLALVMHSSVAMVLMCVVLVSVGALPVSVGVTLVLGANLGGSLVPVWLTRQMAVPARRLALANFGVRGATAILCAAGFEIFASGILLNSLPPGQFLVATHLAFNALLLMFLPVAHLLEAPIVSIVKDKSASLPSAQDDHYRSDLDTTALESPRRSMACLRREVIRMSHILEHMIRPVSDRSFKGDPALISRLHRDRKALSQSLGQLREYVARMPTNDMPKKDVKIVRDLLDYAISLEAAADIITRRMLPVALSRIQQGIRFSDAGWEELTELNERVLRNMTLAFDLLVSDDVEAARQVFLEKDDFNKSEKRSRKRHFSRLRKGEDESLASSDLHIESLSTLREFNALVCSLAYPILIREGQLLESRLIFGSDPD